MTQEFQISLEIYQQDKILEAINDFSEVAPIELQEEVLSISWDTDNDILEVFQEFMNYVLSL